MRSKQADAKCKAEIARAAELRALGLKKRAEREAQKRSAEAAAKTAAEAKAKAEALEAYATDILAFLASCEITGAAAQRCCSALQQEGYEKLALVQELASADATLWPSESASASRPHFITKAERLVISKALRAASGDGASASGGVASGGGGGGPAEGSSPGGRLAALRLSRMKSRDALRGPLSPLSHAPLSERTALLQRELAPDLFELLSSDGHETLLALGGPCHKSGCKTVDAFIRGGTDQLLKLGVAKDLAERLIAKARRSRPVAPSQWDFPSGEIEFLEEVGEGSFGKVFRVRCMEMQMAAKRLQVLSLSERDTVKERLRNEFRALQSVQHPHVVQLYAAGDRARDHCMRCRLARHRCCSTSCCCSAAAGRCC